MKHLTRLCKECSCYFDIVAWEPADITNVCVPCSESKAECAHDNVRVIPFNTGVCAQTGYHDSGEILECCTCGFQEVA